MIRNMMAELRKERQAVAPIAPAAPVAPTALPAPQYRLFDLDAETSRKQPMGDDKKNLVS